MNVESRFSGNCRKGRLVRNVWRGLAAAGAFFVSSLPAAAQDLAVRAEIVHTVAGKPIVNGVVLITGGKIAKVGPADAVVVPAGTKTLSAKVVTPGLIDSRSVVGLAGYLNQPHDQNQVDGGSAIQPDLRAGDAYDPSETLVEWLRGFGVTVLHTGHAPAALVSGQTMVVKTVGKTVEAATMVPEAAVSVTLGSGSTVGTKAKAIAMLRSELVKAKESLAKAGKDGGGARDLKREVWHRVLRKETALMVSAHKATDIAAALRLQREFGFRMWLEGASEATLLVDEIKRAGVPVLLHPTMARPGGESESLSLETASLLRKAGIPFAIQGGYETYVPKTRVVLFEAALAAANGLTFEQALSSITLDAAKVLGIAKRVGSIEAGKDADLALFDGDPFETTSHCVGTVVNGILVFDGKR
jgi:imidazolonepropionase-like amidohydrolase